MFSQIEKRGETWCQYKGLNQIPQKHQTEEAKNSNGKDQDIERKDSGIKKNVKEPKGIHPHPLKIASHHPPPSFPNPAAATGSEPPLAITRHWLWLATGNDSPLEGLLVGSLRLDLGDVHHLVQHIQHRAEHCHQKVVNSQRIQNQVGS